MGQQDQSFGKYKLLARLAQEPTAEVFKAQNTETNQVVVLRLINAAVSAHPQVTRLFEESGELERFQVEHPNLLPVVDFGETGQRRFFCVEYTEGKSLARRMKEGKVPVEEAMDILRQSAEGLRALHQRRLYHGDVKPANIILTKDRKGRLLVKLSLVDLSIASADAMVSIFGELVGTPKYMAPEVIAGERPGVQSDLFALGIVAYEMLCGHPPFHSETVLGFLHKNVHMQEKPLREMDPAIPIEFSLIVHKMMVKSAEGRYRSCQNLLDDLDRAERSVMGGYVARLEPGIDSAFAPSAAPPTAPAEADAWSKRKVIGVALAVVGVGLLILVGIGLGTKLFRHGHKKEAVPVAEETTGAPNQGLEKRATESLRRARAAETKGRLKEAKKEYEDLASKYPATKAAQDAGSKLADIEKRMASGPSKKGAGKEPASPTSPALQAAYDTLNTEAKRLMAKNIYDLSYKKYAAFAEAHDGTPEADMAREQLPAVLFAWAEAMKTGGQEEQALAKYLEIQEKYKDTEWVERAKRAVPEVALNHAKRMERNQDYEKALQEYQNIIDRYADTEAGQTAATKLPDVLLAAAKKDLERNEAEKAIERLTEVTKKYPNAPVASAASKLLPDALLLRAESLLAQGKLAEADAALRDLVDQFGSSEAAAKARDRRAELSYAGVQELIKADKKQEALAQFEELARLYPNSPVVAAHQAEMNALKDQLAPPKPAEATAKPAPAVLYKEAMDLMAQDKKDEAMEKLEKVIQDFADTPWAPKAKEIVAKAIYDEAARLKKEGNVKEAGDALKELAAQYPDTEWARKASEEQPRVAEHPGAMALVEAGTFIMGTDENEIRAFVMGEEEADAKTMRAAMMCETPKHEVDLPAFYMDKTEVANAEYLKFVEETHRTTVPMNWVRGKPLPDKMNDPVVYVSYEDAEAYAKWAGKRLPTEAEWEKGARGVDGRAYPWGRKFDPSKCNFLNPQQKATTPVGSLPEGASPSGCLDMVGNAAEWTASWLQPYPGNKTPQAEYGETHRVVRGGAWNDTVSCYGRCASRRPVLADTRNRAIGFRCAKDAK